MSYEPVITGPMGSYTELLDTLVPAERNQLKNCFAIHARANQNITGRDSNTACGILFDMVRSTSFSNHIICISHPNEAGDVYIISPIEETRSPLTEEDAIKMARVLSAEGYYAHIAAVKYDEFGNTSGILEENIFPVAAPSM